MQLSLSIFFETYHASIQYALTKIQRLHMPEGKKISTPSSEPSYCSITSILK